MKAVVFEGDGRLAVREVPVPAAEGKALVRVRRAGICGTDLKIVSGAIPTRPPLVLGHEVTGVVERSGPEHLVPEGTQVLVDPGFWCGHCADCLNDRNYLCRAGGLMGRDLDGGLAEFMEVDEANLHPFPAGVSRDAEALLQVLATCVHAQARVDVQPGSAAVVIGLGVSGLLHAQLLRLRGAHPVIGVTRSEAKRERARRLGVHETFAPQDALEGVQALTGGRGAATVVEAVGSADALRQGSALAAPGGALLLFGMTTPTADAVPTYDWYFKELDVINTRAARPRDYAQAVALAGAGLLDLAPLVTSSHSIDQAAAAFEACGSPSELKVVIDMAGD